MEIRQGPVSKLRASIEAGGEKRGTGATQVVEFQLGTQAVVLRSSYPASIHDGDTIKVAGAINHGVLEAVAFRNESTGASADRNSPFYLIGGALLCLMGASGVPFCIGTAMLEHDSASLYGAAACGLMVAGGALAVRWFYLLEEAVARLGV